MYAEERQIAILAQAREAGRVDVTSLAELLQVTPETIRRDLTVLERRDLVRRVHGGAMPVERLDFEPRLATRLQQFTTEKQRIAKAALDELPEGGAILLDSGSTTEALAQALPEGLELTVVTNALPIALSLGSKPNLQVWCVGGLVRERTFALVDDWARRLLAEVSVDVAFLGTNGLSVGRGLTTPAPTEAAIKTAMVGAAKRRVVLTDHSKIGRDSFCRFATLSDIDVVITDTGLDDDSTAEIEKCGPRVVRA
jgi:DeoR family fructose operon transcriptional repressor